jgi:hypothetical protein
MYSVSADNLGFATNGVLRLRIDENDNIYGNSNTQFLAGQGSVSDPSISLLDDQDTGFYRGGSNFLSVTCGGVDMASFAGSAAGAAFLPGSDNAYDLGSNALGWKRLFMMDGTAAAPSFTFRNQIGNGIFRPTTDAVGFSAAGTEVARVDNDVTANNTRFMLYDVSAGALVRVSRGAADSGGAGFRLLRIPN